MTRQEIAKKKAQFIKLRQAAMMKAAGEAERLLLEKVFDELFKLIGDTKGKILEDDGAGLKLSTAIERIFTQFNNTTNFQITNNILTTLLTIQSFNQDYFRAMNLRDNRLKKAFTETDKSTKQLIGVDEGGKMVKGGYLDNLLHDDGLKLEIQRETRRAFKNGFTTEQYMNKIREVIVGNDEHMGKLSSHYRTFAHDTFSQFDGDYAYRVAVSLGLRCAIYEGGLIDTSRDFCIKKAGKVFTFDEIENMVNDPDLLLTKEEKEMGEPIDYDPFRDKGRWECRHQWNYITDDIAIKMRPELKNVLK